MVFDDYGCIHFPGVKKAIDESISNCHIGFFLPLSTIHRSAFSDEEFQKRLKHSI